MKKIFLFLFLFSLFFSTSSFSKEVSYYLDPFLEKGTIHKKLSKQNIIEKFGKQNVVFQDVDIGEGEKQKAMVVFPNNPQKELTIFWNKEKLSALRVTHSNSLWKTVGGVGIGTSLKELEKINGKPFKLAGFDWDYGGVVYSWNEGKLAQYHPALSLRLGYSESTSKNEDLNLVLGDKEFSSSLGAMQRINPKVYYIYIGEL